MQSILRYHKRSQKFLNSEFFVQPSALYGLGSEPVQVMIPHTGNNKLFDW